MNVIELRSPAEIAAAQADLDFHPDDSPYWECTNGQESLRIARLYGLEAFSSNRERCALYRAIGEAPVIL